ncbi:NAD-dependent epimerase/dehydratase family protein [Planctomycetota bacterium]
MRKVLVTGADGFAGTRLCAELAERGFRVTGLGLRAGIAANSYEYQILDIMDEDRLNTLIHDVKPELIFHLAAIASTQIAERSLHHAASLNTLAIVNLMKFGAEARPGMRVFLMSTGEVYGPNASLDNPHTEKTPIADPCNFYTATKIAQEYYARILARSLNLPLTIIRPFSMIGPGQNENFVFGSWGMQLARICKGQEEPVIKVGNLEVHRDFTDVRDAVRAFAALTDTDCQPGKYTIYNVCSGNPRLLSEILDRLIGLSGQKVEIEVDKARLRTSDYPIFTGSSARINSACGWEPEFEFTRTLEDILAFSKQKLG